jgi:drug/metabolite transporter (DMT)-like permease
MLKDTSVSRLRVGAAFLAIYLIWGSTYLAIRFAIDTLPPLLMASFRFLIAGPLLYAWVWLKEGNVRPTGLHWKEATVVGGLLVLGGNGCVVLAEQWVPTGIASIIISLVPIWMVLADWARPGGRRPGKWVMLGLILGFAGMILLINPFEQKTLDHVNWTGAFVLLLASLSWSLGSIYSRHARSPNSPILFTAMQMTAGGIMLLVAGTLAGEWQLFHWGQITFRSLAALIYLITFGSWIGFTAYIWLLKVSTVSHVSTYAYVNPVVAVFLGWIFAGEILTPRMLVSALIVIAGVILVISCRNAEIKTVS